MVFGNKVNKVLLVVDIFCSMIRRNITPLIYVPSPAMQQIFFFTILLTRLRAHLISCFLPRNKKYQDGTLTGE